jgi:hypothetical protein
LTVAWIIQTKIKAILNIFATMVGVMVPITLSIFKLLSLSTFYTIFNHSFFTCYDLDFYRELFPTSAKVVVAMQSSSENLSYIISLRLPSSSQPSSGPLLARYLYPFGHPLPVGNISFPSPSNLPTRHPSHENLKTTYP